MERILVTGYLLALGVIDIKKKEIPVMPIAAGLITALGWRVISEIGNEMYMWNTISEILFGIIPGLVLFAIAIISHKAGVADGLILMIPGIIFGYRMAITTFCISLFIMAFVSAMLISFKRADRNTRLPYIPFMAVGMIIGGLIT